MLFFVFLRGQTVGFPEGSGKVIHGVIAHRLGNFTDLHGGIHQVFQRVIHPQGTKNICKGLIHLLADELAQIGLAEMKGVSQRSQGNGAVILLYILQNQGEIKILLGIALIVVQGYDRGGPQRPGQKQIQKASGAGIGIL